MQSDSDDKAPEAETTEATPAATSRADAYRERFRRSQAIAAQVARARAAGGQPNERDAARLVAEFHARGGQVTICPQPEEDPLTEQDRGKPAKRRHQ